MPVSLQIEPRQDNKTGVAYLRIATATADVYHPYFHVESWSADDAGFILNAGGQYRYFDIGSHRDRELSAWQKGIGAPHVSRDGKRVYFVRGQQVCVMPLVGDGSPEVLYDVEAPWRPCEISPNGDDSGMAIMMDHGGLLRRIAYVDLKTKALTVCFEGHNRLGHLQMNPARRDRIMYADQHDPDNWQRMYTVKTNGREHFPFYHQRVGEWVTHECFSRDGQWVTFTVAQPDKGLHIIRTDGSDARRVDAGRYWHACPSPDAHLIAADLYEGEVRLVERDTGKFRPITPAWMPEGRMVPQGLLHPHPCLSRTGRWLLHVDGSGGRATLRLVDLSRLG